MPSRFRPHFVVLLFVSAGCRDDAVAPHAAGPADATRSEVQVSTATVASGATATLMLRTVDAKDRALSAGGRQVLFTTSGGTSTGTIGSTTDRGDGTYQATFTGVTAGTATTINATIDGARVTSPLPVIAVRPGPWSGATSTASVTPRTVLAGGNATIELIARDAAGNRLERGGQSVSFRASGGSGQGVVGPVTDHGNGRYTSPFTGVQVGTPLEISAVVDGTPISTQPPVISVARGISLELSELTFAHDTLSVGAGVRVTLHVRDSANVQRTSGGDTVSFVVAGDGGGEGAFEDFTDHDDGTYSATLTATNPGMLAVGVHINSRRAPERDRWIAVQATRVAPQRSSISVSRSVLAAGETATLVAELHDLNGALITDGAAFVQFTASEEGTSRGTIGPARHTGGGTYEATFRATQAGSAIVISATIDDSARVEMLDSSGTSHLPTIRVTPGSVSLAQSSLEASRTRVPIGDSALVRVIARDAHGNVLTGGGLDVAIRRSGGADVSAGRVGTVKDLGNGSYTAWYFGDAVGTADTLRATISGAALTSAVATVTVGAECVAGPASVAHAQLTINDTTSASSPLTSLALASGVSTTVTLQLNDARGCAVVAPHVVTLAASGGTSTGTLGETTHAGDGRYVTAFTGSVAGSTTTLTASVDGVVVTTPPVRVTVVPGDVSVRASTLGVSRTSLAAGDSATVTLEARDDAGNRVTSGGRLVTFRIVGASPGGVLRAPVDRGDGTYTARYIARVDGSTDTISARIDGTSVQARVSVAVGVAAGSQR